MSKKVFDMIFGDGTIIEELDNWIIVEFDATGVQINYNKDHTLYDCAKKCLFFYDTEEEIIKQAKEWIKANQRDFKDIRVGCRLWSPHYGWGVVVANKIGDYYGGFCVNFECVNDWVLLEKEGLYSVHYLDNAVNREVYLNEFKIKN